MQPKNCLLILCCAPNPSQNFVTSKNDGAFESNIQETAPQQNGEETALSRTGSFASTDGSVEYIWNINQTIIDGPMPVVEAVPYFFTTDDARQVATVLFGDAVFYDIGPESERHYSRGELERKINLLSRYADEDTLSLRFSLHSGPGGGYSSYEENQASLFHRRVQLPALAGQSPNRCDLRLVLHPLLFADR